MYVTTKAFGIMGWISNCQCWREGGGCCCWWQLPTRLYYLVFLTRSSSVTRVVRRGSIQKIYLIFLHLYTCWMLCNVALVSLGTVAFVSDHVLKATCEGTREQEIGKAPAGEGGPCSQARCRVDSGRSRRPHRRPR